VGSIGILTTGIAGLDFANASGSTCSAMTYASHTSCFVNVQFTPKTSGLRLGAVVFFSGADDTGTVLANVPIYGIGTGPELAFAGGSQTAVGNAFVSPQGIATDAAGNVYVADSGVPAVYKVTPAGEKSSVGSGFTSPVGVAVDGAGNVYVADSGVPAVYKVTPAGEKSTVGSGFTSPVGVAVDGAANVYVADDSASAVYMVSPRGTKTTVSSGFTHPHGVAVDGAGNVYVADYGAAAVYKITNGTKTSVGSGFSIPYGVAVDAAGDVYVADKGDDTVSVITPGGTKSTVSSGLTNPDSLTIDASGNLYSSESIPQVTKIDRAGSPSLAFDSTKVNTTSADSPKTVEVENIGNASLTFSAFSYPTDFPEQPTGTHPCSTATNLNASDLCNLNLDFAPQSAGFKSESVTITENSLNVTGTQLSISASGTGLSGLIATTTSASNSSVTYNSSVQTISLQATVTCSGATVNQGTITFTAFAGGTPASVTSSTVTNGSAGVNYALPAGTAAGSYIIQAAYSGSANFAASSENTATLTVNQAPTTTTAANASATFSTVAQSVSVSARVTSDAGVVNVGTVTFGGLVLAPAGTPLGTFPVNPQPLQQSIDASGNVWIASSVNNTVIQMSPSGSILHTYSTPLPPDCVVIDGSGNLWVCYQNNNSVAKMTPSGTIIGTYGVGNSPDSIAIDQRGYVWVTNSGAQNVTVLTATGALVGTYSTGSGNPWNVVIDSAGNAWTDNWTSATVSKISPDGTLLGVYPVGNEPQVLAIDQAGNVWVPNQADATVTKLSPSGVTLFTVSVPVQGLGGLAIDGNANAWVYGGTPSDVVELDSAGNLIGTFPIGIHSAYATIDRSGAIWITSYDDSTIYKLATGSPGVVTPVVATLGVLGANLPQGNAAVGNTVTSAKVTNGAASAAYSLPAGMAAGTYIIPATYNPAGSFNGSSDKSHTLTVSPVPQTITFSASTLSFAAGVTFGVPPLLLSAISTSGLNVTFSLVSGPGAVNGNTLTITGAGTVVIAANQVGNANYAAAPQITENIAVSQASQAITFSASTLSYAAGVPFGVAPLSLSASSTSGLNVTFSLVSGPAVLNGNSLTITGAGSVVIAANQVGDTNYAPASQITENIAVNQILPVAAVTSSLNPVLVQNGITLTATLTSGADTPTGTVTFLDGATALGTGTLSGGVATISTSSLTVGTHLITAAYSGDTNFLAATSSPTTQLVEDFGFSMSGSTGTVQPGGSAVFTFTVNPVKATTFPTTIMLTASGLPEGATYTFSPTSLTEGEGATTTTLTVDLPQTQAADVRSNVPQGTSSRGGAAERLVPLALALILLPFASRLRHAGRRLGRMTSLLLFLVAGTAAVAGLNSCGSSTRFSTQQQQSYSVTIIGTAGALSHSATVTLTVQ
jgi:sugar lactone lactonase YvrE